MQYCVDLLRPNAVSADAIQSRTADEPDLDDCQYEQIGRLRRRDCVRSALHQNRQCEDAHFPFRSGFVWADAASRASSFGMPRGKGRSSTRLLESPAKRGEVNPGRTGSPGRASRCISTIATIAVALLSALIVISFEQRRGRNSHRHKIKNALPHLGDRNWKRELPLGEHDFRAVFIDLPDVVAMATTKNAAHHDICENAGSVAGADKMTPATLPSRRSVVSICPKSILSCRGAGARAHSNLISVVARRGGYVCDPFLLSGHSTIHASALEADNAVGCVLDISPVAAALDLHPLDYELVAAPTTARPASCQ